MMQQQTLVHRFWFALKASALCLFAPGRFAQLSAEHKDKPARIIRRAFFLSGLLTAGALLAGYFLGSELKCSWGPASASAATFFQAASAALVLIATLAVRGWEIQTWGGDTLAEKVNQWLTRALFVLGIFFFSLFLGWAQ